MKTEFGHLLMDDTFIFAPTGEPKSWLTTFQVLKHREKHGTSLMYFDIESLSISPFTDGIFKDLENVDD